MSIRFDESLPRAVSLAVELFGPSITEECVFLRDATGRLALIVSRTLEEGDLAKAQEHFSNALGAYARPIRPISDLNSVAVADLLAEGLAIPSIQINGLPVHYLDRRIVGADWLLNPAPSARGIPRLVFFSLKGGVGRSTALTVAAAHLSRKGQRVLAIDFDLEAPGIGTMLLRPEELPPYGTLDYLVENSLSGVDEHFLLDTLGNSYLGSEGARVAVIPAIGRCTLENPANALPKISRAYLEDIREGGDPISLAHQMGDLVDRFSDTGEFDVVLIDARAGLNEISAGAILGLGGTILMFGVDEPQTYLGYRLLLSHLAMFQGFADTEWRDRFMFVHAKRPGGANDGSDEQFHTLMEILYPPITFDLSKTDDFNSEDFELSWDDTADFIPSDEGIDAVIHIEDSSAFRGFDPVRRPDQLDSSRYEPAFSEFLEIVDFLTERDVRESPE